MAKPIRIIIENYEDKPIIFEGHSNSDVAISKYADVYTGTIEELSICMTDRNGIKKVQKKTP